MRVLEFCPALSSQSGSGIRARLIAEGLNSNNVDVCVVSEGVPESFSGLGITNYLLEKEKSWDAALSEAAEYFKPDIIYGITEAGTDAVMRTARKFQIPFLYDLHGIGAIEIIELGSGYGSRIRRIKDSLRWLARIPKADAVTIANPTLLPIIKRLNKKTFPLLGMTDVSHFSPLGPIAKLNNSNADMHILYAGNYFKWQGIDLLIDSAKRLLRDNISFHMTIIGSIGKDMKKINYWKESLPSNKVNFCDSVDYSKIADYYRAADVLVIPRPFMLSTYLAFPQKLVDYMASGRTIVATDLAPHRWAIGSPKAGILCSTDAKGFSVGIQMAADPRVREELSLNARKKAVEIFCHIKQTKRISSLMNSILKDR